VLIDTLLKSLLMFGRNDLYDFTDHIVIMSCHGVLIYYLYFFLLCTRSWLASRRAGGQDLIKFTI
jgi:hypothetical protein